MLATNTNKPLKSLLPLGLGAWLIIFTRVHTLTDIHTHAGCACYIDHYKSQQLLQKLFFHPKNLSIMNTTLKRLSKIKSGNCITIVLNTHRTHPDAEKDAILLKTLVNEAIERLSVSEDKNAIRVLTEKLETPAKSVDHRENLDSLLLFVNKEISELVRLPLPRG